MQRGNSQQFDRRTLLRALGAGALGIAGAAGASGTALADHDPDQYHNPVGPFGMGDPTVLQWHDGTYYAYGTHRHFARSEDLVHWEDLSPVVDWEPDWHGDPEAGFWAPDVNWFNDQVYLYYSHSTWGSQDNPGIGVATADHPEGPFENHGPVFRDEDLPHTNCIDSDLVVEDGTPYLIWGSFFGIWGVELTPDGMDYVPGTEFQLAGDNREGPMIVRENGYYYLFLSTGHCCQGYDSTYEVEVGRAESLFGPYYTRDGQDLTEIHDHHAGQAVLSATDQFVSPGHNTAVQDDAGNWWMLYHVEATADRAGRIMMLDRIRFDDEDWPVVGCDGVPCETAARPVVGDAEQGSDGTPVSVEEGTYALENVNSGLFLEVADASTDDGATVQQGSWTGEPHQYWEVVDDGEGYLVINANSGKALEVFEAATDDGADVVQWSDTGGAHQRWVVLEDDQTGYVIENVGSGQVLDVFEAATEDGAEVVQWPDSGGENQRWLFEPVDGEHGPPPIGDSENPPKDLNGDGMYRDVDGTGSLGSTDVVTFFEHFEDPAVTGNPEAFDFDGNGALSITDVIELFDDL